MSLYLQYKMFLLNFNNQVNSAYIEDKFTIQNVPIKHKRA